MEIKKVSQLLNKILRKDQEKNNKFKIRYDCYINWLILISLFLFEDFHEVVHVIRTDWFLKITEGKETSCHIPLLEELFWFN